MTVEAILMSDVKDLGAEGDVVSVADGYARNYLFPRKLAAPVTEVTRRQLEKIRRERNAAREAELATSQSLADKMAQVSCTIPVKVGEDDKMFGSVTTSDIAATLEIAGVEIDRHKIVLAEPIRELGVYDVAIKVHPEIEVTIKVWVVEE
jgi:large subunit ribosomal protein L9